MRILLAVILLMALGARAEKTDARILKVLPHFLDRAGRHTLSPSLYERDAYQAQLRANPGQISSLRFDVQWRARAADPSRLKLRLELRTSGEKTAQPLVLDQSVRPSRRFSTWSHLTLDGPTLQKAGKIVAWRATLIEGDVNVAELQSFLW